MWEDPSAIDLALDGALITVCVALTYLLARLIADVYRR